jgi:hypothetical protein
MEQKIINTENYLLIVDDSEIKGKGFRLDLKRNSVGFIDDDIYYNERKDEFKKIISHLPLNNSPILEGVPILPPLEDEVDKFESFLDREIELNTKETIDRIKWYYQQYFKSKEKNYTEDDLMKVIDMAREYTPDVVGFTKNEIIQSLKQPKMPVGFKCEIEAMNIDEIREQGKGFLNTNTKKLKTTTNSQGLTQLVGEYIY